MPHVNGPTSLSAATKPASQMVQLEGVIENLMSVAVTVHSQALNTRIQLLGEVPPSPDLDESPNTVPGGLLYQLKESIIDIDQKLHDAQGYQEEVLASLSK